MILPLYLLTFLPLSAQTTFTERLQKSNSGEGKVTVTQSKEIEVLVNGKQAEPTEPAAKEDAKTVTVKKLTVVEDGDVDTPVDNHKKVMLGSHKVAGYRIQVYAGGNSRKDKQQAEQTGNSIKRHFPEVPVYVHFYSPRWICRVGNFRTYEEAYQALLSMKQMGYTSASIVKGMITVQY